MKKRTSIVNIWILIILLVTACTPEVTATPTTAAVEPDLYLNIIWHQHQPFYASDPETGLVSAPWVRFHATKDYVDMAAMLEAYPDIHVTFNLTPSLIQQIDALNNGTLDKVWATTLIPANELTDEEKEYILLRFFDVNGNILKNFPRYLELQTMRSGTDDEAIASAIASWTDQDFLDLQVLFNLAWTDPEVLTVEPLDSIVSKGSNFTEADKQTVLNVHAELLAAVIPTHKDLQDKGQIEVTFTPYAHPILPLLIDTNLAQQAVPDISLPSTRFTYGQDAIEHLERGMNLYEDHFGKIPEGMWPAEGSVAQLMVGMTARAGVTWMVTDEGVLANTTGTDFTRLTGGVPNNATSLYRPYTVGKNEDTVTIFFRDTQLSNKVSFDYSPMDAIPAVDDFMSRLHAIRDAVKDEPGGPYIVTVILDGENAWEYYANDGKDFLNGLYTALSADDTIKTVTASEFLKIYEQEPEPLSDLWAGSWDNATFETWIGEAEENRAWDYLATTRASLEEYISGNNKDTVDQINLDAAYNAILAAEGSDWFWWYGSDKDSGNDAAFDAGFRETLGQVYDALDLERPEHLLVPIIQPVPAAPDIALEEIFTPVIDGIQTTRSEWQSAGAFDLEPFLDSMYFGFDKNALYLFGSSTNTIIPGDIYLKIPSITTGNAFSENRQVLGIYATHRIRITHEEILLQIWDIDSSTWVTLESELYNALTADNSFEMAIPLSSLASTLDTGDNILIRIESGDTLFPANTPGRMTIPDLGRTTWLIDVLDPEGDDYGPGTYTYPTDGVFKPGVFDLIEFKIGQDESNIVFNIRMKGAVENPWNAANGLSIQLVEIYLDVDGSNTGARILRNGRNAALIDGSGWEYAVTIAGWNAGIYPSTEPEIVDKTIPLTIITDPGKNTITAKIPLGVLPGDPANWHFAVVILSNDGYGINGARDVIASGGQWAIGGAPDDKNHTRILDLLLPAETPISQEEYLTNYQPSQADPSSLLADDLPQVPVLP